MDVALGAPLDLIQQNLHRLKGHLPLGLLHRSQVDPRHGRRCDVVKSHQTQLLRHPDPKLVRRPQNPQGVGVRGGQDGRIVQGLGKQLPGQLIAAGH